MRRCSSHHRRHCIGRRLYQFMVVVAVGIHQLIMVVIILTIVMMLVTKRRMIVVILMITVAMLIKGQDRFTRAIAIIIGNAARQLHHQHRHKGKHGDGTFHRAGMHDEQLTN